MVAIEVDFEVFKEITIRRETEEMTENEVIRELLGLRSDPGITLGSTSAPEGIPWVCKGVTFPHGTEFRTSYKGQQYNATVQNGALVLSGRRYSSPSAAAVSITENAVNGWRFWECKLPTSNAWKTISTMRR